MFKSLCLLVLFLTVSVSASSPCYERYTESDTLINRYQTAQIYAVNEQATDVESIKVWIDTPNCTQWTYRGCTLVCTVIGRYCNSLGSILPILHSSCSNTYHKKLEYVYDRSEHLKHDAPVRSKLGVCYFSLQFYR
jgi:hypothetical protein